MSDEQPAFNHRDLAAYALLFCTLFLAIALATYDPADQIGPLVAPLHLLYSQDLTVTPPNDAIRNQCGWWGALAADMLYTSLGAGAYFVLAGMLYLDIQMLRRKPLDTVAMRMTGAALSLVGLTGFAALTFPNWTPGPVYGSGGALGAMVAWFLDAQFATTGGVILCLSLAIAGLIVSTDYAVYRAAAFAGGAVATAAHGSRGMLRRQRPADRLATDVEDPFADLEGEFDDGEDGEATVPIKIRGEVTDEPLDDADDEEAAESEWEDWDDEEADSGSSEEYEIDEDDEEAEEEEEDEIVVKTPKPKSKNQPEPSEREQIFAELEGADYKEDDDYELPAMDLLIEGDEVSYDAQRKELAHKARLLEKTFKDFGLNVKVVEIETGPVIAQYEIELEAGLRLAKITNLADDIAIALRVPSVRIVSPIPGKNTVGIEVPNAKRQMVRLRDVIEETNGKAKKMKIPLFLGQDVSGNPMTADLAALPHLLIAGRTGTGKSVCLNAIISSILMTKRPDEVRMLMIDPKMVELSGYGRLPHLMHPVVTDMKKAEAILAWAVDKMEERYSLLARAGVRHITSYNQLGEEELMERLGVETDEERADVPQHLPFIVIIADEMADLMMTAGKEVEQHIIRLAQKSRAVGIHLILATQKPTVDVITGLIKSNLPARISFQVASRTDSRVVLDEMGAEKLLGHGDMLFLWPGTSTLLRGQGTYLGDEEIDRVVDAASVGEQNFVNELVNMNVAADDGGDRMEELRKRDDLYESAIEVVIREQRGSCSLLQRSLGIGYGRAARLVDFMAEDGIVGSYAGSQAREVLLSMDDWERMQGFEGGNDDPPPPPPPTPPTPPKSDKRSSKKSEESEAPAATRTDGPSKPKPQRVTAEAAVNGPPKPKRRNRIVLAKDESDDELLVTEEENETTVLDLELLNSSNEQDVFDDELEDDEVEAQDAQDNQLGENETETETDDEDEFEYEYAEADDEEAAELEDEDAYEDEEEEYEEEEMEEGDEEHVDEEEDDVDAEYEEEECDEEYEYDEDAYDEDAYDDGYEYEEDEEDEAA